MEIESNMSDIDHELLQKLNTMGTRDKEDLINQFQSIVGTQMTQTCCAFYLDMGNWNLQTALGAYYDVMSSSEQLPLFNIVEETLHIEENSVQPGQHFLKKWQFKNIGSEPWPTNLKLKYVGGTNFSHGDCATLPPLQPNDTTELFITMIAPLTEGMYHGKWRVITLSGIYCGSTLDVIVNVDSSNINVLTKQMSSLGSHQNSNTGITQPMSTPLRPETHPTPFCSPTGYGMFGGGGTNISNGFNGNLSVINENMHINIDEEEITERTSHFPHEPNQGFSGSFPNS